MNRPLFTARSYDERRNPQSPVIPMLAESASDAFVRRYLAVLMRYTGVGIIGTCAHYVLLLALVDSLGPVAASTVGATAGCLLNFQLARRFVFADRVYRNFALQKFVAVAGGGVVVNSALMLLLTAYLPTLASQLIATASVFFTGFTLNNVWSFGERQA